MMQLMALAPGWTVADTVDDETEKAAFDFGGISVHVSSSSPGATTHLRRAYSYFGSTHPRDVGVRLEMSILADGSSHQARFASQLASPRAIRGHGIATSWFPWLVVVSEPGLVNYYASKLLRLAVVEAATPAAYTIHAASIARGENGVLLIGEAASGKTTLTLELISRQCTFCADDTTPIRSSDLHCLPFPMPFTVRAERDTDRPRDRALWDREPDISIVGEPRWLVDRSDALSEAFRPTHLLFLDPEPTANGDLIEPIRKVDGLLGLLRNSVFGLGAQPAMSDTRIDHLGALVAGATCARLNTADLDRAADALWEILDG